MIYKNSSCNMANIQERSGHFDTLSWFSDSIVGIEHM